MLLALSVLLALCLLHPASLSRCPCRLAFNPLQRPSYKARPFKKFCHMLLLSEECTLCGFFFFLPPPTFFFFLHWCLHSPKGNSFGFPQSCSVSSPLGFKKGRKKTSRREDKTAHQEAPGRIDLKPRTSELQLETLWQGMSFPSWYLGWSCE